jgi:hypothetical protein
MATRSHIGKQLENGQIKYIYCHWDGYLEHNGAILKEHYTTEAKVDELLVLGGLSVLGKEIGEKQDFDNRDTHNPDWCLAYGRDRDQNNFEVQIGDMSDFIYQDYHYLFVDGKWKCFGSNGRELVL